MYVCDIRARASLIWLHTHIAQCVYTLECCRLIVKVCCMCHCRFWRASCRVLCREETSAQIDAWKNSGTNMVYTVYTH